MPASTYPTGATGTQGSSLTTGTGTSASTVTGGDNFTRPAADTRGGVVLTLADVLAAARRNPPSVLTAMANVNLAQAQIPIARAALLPTVSAQTDATLSLSRGQIVVQGMSATGTSLNSYVEAAITARWTIWDFGRTNRSVSAAQHGVTSAREDQRVAVRNAVTQAAAAYYVLLSDEETVASAQEVVRQREQELEIARGLVQSGARAAIEQTRAEVALDSARLDLAVAEAATANDSALLSSALAMDPAVPVRVAQPTEVNVDDDPAHAASAAVASRPELASARARLAQAEAQLAVAHGQFLPTLSANASATARYAVPYSFTDSMANRGGSDTEFGFAQIALSVPIYDPSITAQIRLAEAQVAVARVAIEQQSLTIRTDAVQAAVGVRSARHTLEQAQRLAAGAHANLEQAQGRYQAGAAPLLELVDAQASDATARVQVIRARLQFELAKVRLLAAIGQLTDYGVAR